MSTEAPLFSAEFTRLYCDPAVFEHFSEFHPISFKRVLPFQSVEEGVDEQGLLRAEQAHLQSQTEYTRRAVIDDYSRCGLLEIVEADQLRPALDFYDADFFEFMGMVYTNAGRYRCALRWYGELINRLERQNPNTCSDTESVYASAGYCLYALGLFEECIAWSKACLGPRLVADVVSRALVEYEAELAGGTLCGVERAGPAIRYVISAFEPEHAAQQAARLKPALKTIAPFEEVYLEWIGRDSLKPQPCPDGYPFRAESDGGSLVRHKMNLIFATCWQADALLARGYQPEAKRLLWEAAMIEPQAEIVAERLKQFP